MHGAPSSEAHRAQGILVVLRRSVFAQASGTQVSGSRYRLRTVSIPITYARHPKHFSLVLMLACETALDRLFVPSIHGGHSNSDDGVVLALDILFLEDQLC